MPEMDGIEATLRIRASQARYRNIPIIATTASTLDAEIQACISAGMNDSIKKPIDPRELAEKLCKWGRLEGGAESAATAVTAPASEKSHRDIPVLFDRDVVTQLIESIDPEGVADLLKSFVSQVKLVLEMRDDVSESDRSQDVFRAAHSLKSSSAMFGLHELSSAAQGVEDAIKQGADIADPISVMFTEANRAIQSADVLLAELERSGAAAN